MSDEIRSLMSWDGTGKIYSEETVRALQAEIERLREALEAERNWINTTLRNRLSAASLELNMHIREWSEEA